MNNQLRIQNALTRILLSTHAAPATITGRNRREYRHRQSITARNNMQRLINFFYPASSQRPNIPGHSRQLLQHLMQQYNRIARYFREEQALQNAFVMEQARILRNRLTNVPPLPQNRTLQNYIRYTQNRLNVLRNLRQSLNERVRHLKNTNPRFHNINVHNGLILIRRRINDGITRHERNLHRLRLGRRRVSNIVTGRREISR